MNVKRIHESVAEAPVKSGNRWRVIVARPGVGSSGKYSEEVFKRDAAKIVPPNAQAYVNHDVKRDPREMIGTGCHFWICFSATAYSCFMPPSPA